MACWNVIDHQEFNGAAAHYEKTSIPSTYDHLLFMASARTDNSAWYDFVEFEFNGDTGTDYSSIFTQAFVAGASGVGTSYGTDYTHGGQVAGGSAGADIFGQVEIWIPNYADTVHHKQAFMKYALPTNSSTDSQWAIGMATSSWHSTAAINAFKYQVYGGTDDFVQYSTFTLIGIKGV
jgi:hypothetical protein